MNSITRLFPAGVVALFFFITAEAAQPSRVAIEKFLRRSRVLSSTLPTANSKAVQTYVYNPGDEDPDPNEVPIKVTYSYQVDGYRMAGLVSGTTASSFSNQALISRAVIQSTSVRIQIGTIGMYGASSAGWEILGNFGWYFPNFYPGPVRLLFVYHHGYNTTSEWHSALQYGSMGPFGRLVNHFGPHDANQGGHYNCWGNLVSGSEIPTTPNMAATQVMSKEKTNYLGYGDSYLQDIEMWSTIPNLIVQESFNYDYFLPFDDAESATVINLPIVGVGLYDYEKDFVPNSVVAPTPLVQKVRNSYNAVAWITQNELNALYGGSIAAFKSEIIAEQTRIRIAPAPYPEKSPLAVQYTVDGGTGSSEVHSLGGQAVVSYRLLNQ